ncbi:hypothetical protein AB0I61_09350 [Polymorphospora rubra]
MTVYDIAAKLPSIDVLRDRCDLAANRFPVAGRRMWTVSPSWTE